MSLHESLHALLSRVDERAPVARKRLLGPSINYGREALVGWVRTTRRTRVGWEAATLRRLADELALVALHESGRRVANDVELAALSAAALEAATAEGSTPFDGLVSSVGFRRAVHDAVMELRIAGVGSAQLAGLRPLRDVTRALGVVLRKFEQALDDAGLADPAHIFASAVASFEREAPFVLGRGELVVAGLDQVAGLPAALLALVMEYSPAAACWTAPPLDDELRGRIRVVRGLVPEDEVVALFRAAGAEQWPLDELELVASERDQYGAALHTVAERVQVPFTALHGLAFADCRLGRAMARALQLLTADFLDSASLATALECGELQVPDDAKADAAADRATACDTAAFVRTHRVGGGQDRLRAFRESLARAAMDGAPRRHDDEDASDDGSHEALNAVQMDRTARLLGAILALRDDAGRQDDAVAPAAIADALLRWLAQLVPVLADECSTRARLAARLTALAATPRRIMPTVEALAEVAALFADVRVWPSEQRGVSASAGGAVHLTDLRHAGATARRVVWFAGLSADAVRGSGREAPLVDDATRARLRDACGRALPDSAARTHLHRRRLEAAIAASLARGATVCCSWSAGAADESAPDRLLLEVLRGPHDDAALEPHALHRTAIVASAVPAADALLDARDAWLHALLADGPRDGEAAVEASHAPLARWAAGARAWELRDTPLCREHGHVPEAIPLVPTIAGISISPTELASMLACPRRWFLRRALQLHEATEDDEPGIWLDAAAYGLLVHAVYARAVHESVAMHADTADAQLATIAEDAVRALALTMPSASAAAPADVLRRLHADVRVFLEQERVEPAEALRQRTAEVTRRSGTGGALVLSAARRLQLHARLDRIDMRADGSLDVWDFKTGKAFDEEAPPTKLVQAMAGAHLAALPGASVHEAGYRFDTERADGARLIVSAERRAEVVRAADQVLSAMEQGWFPPTAAEKDSPCTHCAFVAICRVTSDSFRTDSPPAAWARAHAVRSSDDTDPVRRVALACEAIHGGSSESRAAE